MKITEWFGSFSFRWFKPRWLRAFTDKRERLHLKQRWTRGFDNTELWNLSYHLAKFIAPRLKALRGVQAGYLACMTEKQWNVILDKMIYAFEVLDDEDIHSVYKDKQGNWIEDPKERDKAAAKVQEGLVLFGKYFQSLWY
jgi:hypothetical protein